MCILRCFGVISLSFSGIFYATFQIHHQLIITHAIRAQTGSTPKSLSGQQVSDLLQRVSVFHTYAAAHAKTSDEMAKRAESRAQEAKLAVTEAEADEKKAAEQQAAMVAAASVNTSTKRPADQVAAARAAHAENVAKQAKANPTKLEKDIAKEIKLLKTN